MGSPRRRPTLAPCKLTSLRSNALLSNGKTIAKNWIKFTARIKKCPRENPNEFKKRRGYDLMAKLNMFTGYSLAPAIPSSGPKITEDKREVLRFVKLTMLWYNADRRRWEATLYDQAKGGVETNLNTRILNELKVYGDGEDPLLDAKVVHIDEEQLIFKEEGKFYRMRCGEFIYPAIREPLETKELKTLKLVPGS